jgi:LPXTG-motif cell wall-anchored protein
MLALIAALLVIWLLFVLLGFIIKGLIWLAIIGIVLFLGTAAWGWLKRRTSA